MGLKSAKKRYKQIIDNLSFVGLWKYSNLFGKILFIIMLPFLSIFYFCVFVFASLTFLIKLIEK